MRREDPSRPFVVSSPSNGKLSEEEGHIARDPYSELYGDGNYYFLDELVSCCLSRIDSATSKKLYCILFMFTQSTITITIPTAGTLPHFRNHECRLNMDFKLFLPFIPGQPWLTRRMTTTGLSMEHSCPTANITRWEISKWSFKSRPDLGYRRLTCRPGEGLRI